MAEPKDQGIKLFGRRIPLPEVSSAAHTDASFDESIDLDPSCSMDSSSSSDKNRDSTDGEERACGKDILGKKPTETKQKDGSQPEDSEESSNPDATAEMSENHKLPSNEKEKTTSETSKTEEEHSEPSTSQDKTLKKPDKILPCPRCNSMDTKFCYYNNYNVNQPRHFCKNCQRYWTAGGTMRNVPVGAGRRKSKNSANQYRHITVSEALQNGQTDVPHVVHLPPLKTNGTVLTFGSDAPLCESVASVLNIADKTMRNCSQNGFHKPEKLQVQLTGKGGENGHADSNGSSMTVSNSNDEGGKIAPQEAAVLNDQGFPPQMLCYPVAPWPYPWTSAQWASPSPAPSPAFCPLGFPMPFYPAATYWGTMPGTCWIPQPSSPRTPCSGPNTPTLGKHSRDENMVKQSNSRDDKPHKENYSERCLWIPKTLRIDDPGEAAKSSIWRTLGIKNDKTDSIGGGGLFKAFQPKGNEKNHVAETFPVLQANPAALSRSIKFQESS